MDVTFAADEVDVAAGNYAAAADAAAYNLF
jgi:hypothetical protein